MAISALKASQLATLLAGHAKMFTANNPGQNEFADYLLRSGQSATMGLLAEEEEKKRKKKEKGLLGGKIGSALGSAAGIALAPVTGGASMALAGAAGGAIGGLGGQLLSGGSPSMSSVALDAAQGGLSGYTYGKAGELANNVQTSGVQPDIPASPDIAAKIGTAQANALPSIMTTSPGAMANTPAAASALTPSSSTGRYVVEPAAKNLAMVKRPGQLGVPAAAQRTRPAFGSRLFGALNHTMNPQQAQQPTGKLQYTTPGGYEVWY